MKFRMAVGATMTTAATTAALLVGVGPAAADATYDKGCSTRYGDLRMYVTRSGNLQTNLEVRSLKNPIKAESLVEVVYHDGGIVPVKFPKTTRDEAGAYIHTNPVNRPGVRAVNFRVWIGPGNDFDSCGFLYYF